MRNTHNAESTCPFVILTDSEGKIAFCEPVPTKRVHKIGKILENLNQGLPPVKEKRAYVEMEDAVFEEHFNKVISEVSLLAVEHPEAMELLKHFEWKGVIAIHLKRLSVNPSIKPKHMATYMVNIKAKDHHLRRFLEVTEFDKLRVEKWERPGFYFKINQQVIPTFEIALGNLSRICTNCSTELA